MSYIEEIIWSQKYRPERVEDCILPKHLRDIFQSFIQTRSVPNLILSGPQGSGKTTVAVALCKQLDYDYILINGSNEGRLMETFRTTITNFASSVSMTRDRKCVIIDEFDASPESVQLLMRQFMELHSKNCSFIMTCNYKNRIIEPLHSRSTVIDFKIPAEEKKLLSASFYKKSCEILEQNNILYDKKVLVTLVQKFAPDWRRLLNELQKYAVGGNIDVGILTIIENTSVNELVSMMKSKDFKGIHAWAFTQSTIDMCQLCRELTDRLRSEVVPSCVPAMYITVADYQFKHTVAIDPVINIVAMFAQLMFELEFK